MNKIGIALLTLFLLTTPVFAQEDLSGIHIMPDGSVMLGNGETLNDALVTEDNMIELGDGRIVKPAMDLRSGGESMKAPITSMMEGAGTIKESNTSIEGLSGIHIMPNGRVMTGTGFWVEDAIPLENGRIQLGSGEIVYGMDMRSGDFIKRYGNNMVVNENLDRLPPGCAEISGEMNITVTAGVEVAKDIPGFVYSYDERSIEDVPPCTLLTVTFKNKDSIRHQYMVHNLPAETYPMSMFNIEVNGPGEQSGTFITPSGDSTLFVHCGVPEHEAKGMAAQIKVGKGSGNFPGIPGITLNEDGSRKFLFKDFLGIFSITSLLAIALILFLIKRGVKHS